MKIIEPLPITCPGCGRHFLESKDWFLAEGLACPVCGASFAEIQKPLRLMIQDWQDFVQEAEFIVEIECRWKLELSDDDARRLTSAESVCDFVVQSSLASAGCLDAKYVWTEICEIAREKLGVPLVLRDTDLLACFRRTLPQ